MSEYTKEQEARLKAVYQPNESQEKRDVQVASLAKEFGRTVPSVRQKLVRMELYVKKAYQTKNGSKPETKETIVQEIANVIGVASTMLSGLEKATKNCLNLLRDHVRESAELVEETESE